MGIWAKVYAHEAAQHAKTEQDKVDRITKERQEQKMYLSRQLEAQRRVREGSKKEEVDYAMYQEQDLAKWKQEELQKEQIKEQKNDVEKQLFRKGLRDDQERRARAQQRQLRSEKAEVQVAAKALADDKGKKERAKAEMKVKMARIQKENIASLEVKRQRRLEMIEYEKQMTTAYQAKLDKQQADREAALKATSSHQALLYAAGKSTQEEIEEFNRKEEAKMLIKATIAGGGVIPHIHKSLINKSSKKK